jgi:hypothetical protein
MRYLQWLELAHQFSCVSFVPFSFFFLLVLEELFDLTAFADYTFLLTFLYMLDQFVLWNLSRLLEPSEELRNLCEGCSVSVVITGDSFFIQIIRGVRWHVMNV